LAAENDNKENTVEMHFAFLLKTKTKNSEEPRIKQLMRNSKLKNIYYQKKSLKYKIWQQKLFKENIGV